MATQVPYGHPQGGWNHAPQQLPPAEQDDSGVQVRPMGLKVQYTLNSEDRNNYLARYPHPLQIQTMTDESNTIGVVDLRICVEAITTCSPELSSHENDYTIYATDYSEPDSPLVGQGLLSWALDTMRPETASQHVPQLITGVVRKNKLGLLRGGGETLEVKLKLTTAVKVQRPPDRSVEQPRPVEIPHGRPMDQPLTPTGSAEWSSFIQSNPHIGQQRPQSQSQPPHPQYHQPNHSSRVASPALSQGPPPSLHDRHDSFGPGFPPHNPPQNPSPNPAHSQPHTTAQELPKLAPLTAETAQMLAQQGVNTSRPSSRASNKAPARKKTATGRPRGRPRKKAAEGNTSGYEDGTEGEDAPMKKRAKTTKVDQANENAFISGPDSLRVAASTSGSLRSFRPVGSGGDGAQGNHLQEVPRAPTPVPDASLGGQRQSVASNLRRISTMNRSSLPQPTESQASMSPPNDGARSPNSNAPTPAYSGDESAADIASSPPLPRATPYIRSSPPPSSPVLPPMPQPQMSREPSTVEDDMDDLFGENPDMGEMLPENAPQPTRSSKGLCNKKKVPERTTVSNIPMQVFRMEPGPDGADMVHIRNLNTPEPSSMPAGPPEPSYLPHPRIQPNLPQPLSETQQAAPQQSTTLAPTPPSTTDAIEPSTTPQPAPETETGNSKGPDHKEEPVPDRAPEENTQGAGSASKEREQIQPIAVQDEPAAPSAKPAKPKPRSRKLARSQSAGILALPIPASEPAGPSSLSRGVSASSKTQKPTTNPSAPTLSRRAASIGPAPPASDPGVPTLAIKTSIQLALPIPALPAPTEATPAPSSPAESFNKNMVKKNAIKQRLEEAIANGEMPPFCSNCGAIETPTWRKVWTQEKDGAPEWVECSEKPGRVTAIDVLRCDEAGLPLAHRLTKKSLSMDDDRADWQQMLLCNPCGIWLVKSKKHRPQDRWDKDASRLGQNRKRRAGGAGGSRSKKARTQNDMQINPTSEAFSMGDLPTDAMVPIDLSSPEPTTEIANETGDTSLMQARSVTQDTEAGMTQADEMSVTDAAQANTESAQSQDSGTNRSTRVEVLDSSVGNTRRLLFPSPHKDNSPKVLGEVDANVVHSIEYRSPKDLEGEENAVSVPIKDESTVETPTPAPAELPYTPGPARPSTPPPQAKDQDPASEDAFKTPTRPTPSHRPITRSVSRSIKSLRYLMSPMAVEQAPRTPSKSTPRNTLDVKHTPKSNLDVRTTPMLRRSPRFQEEGQITIDPQAFEDMLSDPAFMSGGLDLENIHFDEKDMLEFASFFSTDAAPPSTPPPKSPTPPLPPMEGSYWTRFGLEHIESSLSVKDPKGKGKAQENNS